MANTKWFLCFLCERYKNVKEMRKIYLEGDVTPRLVCVKCLEQGEEKGISKKEALGYVVIPPKEGEKKSE